MDLKAHLAAAVADQYTIERELGRGGMAVVFLARDHKHDRPVAIKVFRPDLSASLGADRFLHEIQVTARLHHPHIVPLYDSGASDGLLFYTMPFVEGETLRARLERSRQLPVTEALQVAAEVADALGHAHSRGVVHRDIKPENILLADGHALVADFGVAGAISAAAQGRRLTQPGLAIGTPTYMSPEQAGGADELDGRSDVYSLGCVLHEMLAGDPPFTGPTPQALAARHLQEEPPRLSVVRASCPAHVVAAVEQALAKSPADRFQTAQEFRAALAASGSAPAAAPPRRGLRSVLATAVVGVATLTAILLWPSGGPPLDPARYVVAPFEHRGGAAPTLLDGSQCQWRVADALRAWDPVHVADNFLVVDALRRRTSGTPATDDWVAVAASLGAGRLVRGELAQFGDTVFVTASAFDVAAPRVALAQASLALPADGDVGGTFRHLAQQLLGLDAPLGQPSLGATRSLAAGQAFVAGQRAIQDGELRNAARQFTAAAQADPEFADAYFWAAQAMVWDGRDPETWMAEASRAVDLLDRLHDPRAVRYARLNLALAAGRYPEACDGFREVLAADSTDFAAWFGLGECHFRDDVVLRDPARAAMWQFRSSYHTAAEAFRRGLAIAPWLTGALFYRLQRLQFTSPADVRAGTAAAPDTGTFWAYPALAADTLAFSPHRAAAVRAGAPGTTPATKGEALARNRASLRSLALHWAEAYPRRHEARLTVAEMLEDLAQSDHAVATLRSALAEVQTARRLAAAQDSVPPMRHWQTEVRIRLKLGDHAGAVRAARDMLRSADQAHPRDAASVAGVAVLVGRVGLAEELLAGRLPWHRRAFPRPWRDAVPVAIEAAAESLKVRAAIASDPLDVAGRLARLQEAVDRLPEGDARDRAGPALLDLPAALAFPAVGRTARHTPDAGNDLLRLQLAWAMGDTAAVRARLDSLSRLRADIRVQDVAPSRMFQEVWLRAAIGDTAVALATLRDMLAGLPGYSRRVLTDAPDPAALVQAYLLGAALARAAADPVWSQWARDAETLWGRADEALLPLLQRLRALR